MSRALICALAIGGFAASAQAADLGGLKDPIPDNLSYHGVTLYGTIDVGAAYQDHGAPLSGSLPTGLEYNITGSRNNGKTVASIAPNGLSQSFVGIKVEENIGGGWVAIGKLETGFVPTSGELADGCASLVRVNNKDQNHAISNGDSSRCGQAINGPAYAGVSNSTYGTLTVGRQNSLQLDTLAAYDPQGLAYAFSVIGYSGFTAGAGDTENGRWDNSLKYVYQYGPMHAAVQYTNGGQDTGIQNGAYSFNIGGKIHGLSLDAVYAKENGAVSAGAFGPLGAVSPGTVNANQLNATISDSTLWSLQGKYTFELGGGGYKDEGPGSKLTLFAGYENVTLANPEDAVNSGSTTVGGYTFAANNSAFSTDRKQQVWWTGAKYELPSGWSFAGAYYRYDQDAFLAGGARLIDVNGVSGAASNNNNCAAVTQSNKNGQSVVGGVNVGKTFGNTVGANCAGTLNSVSFVADYQFNKHFDVYAGVQFGEVSGGLASGFLNDNMTTVMTGARLKF